MNADGAVDAVAVDSLKGATFATPIEVKNQ